jgi:3-oxoacyl-[acyl-carrier-protein] synthase II
MKSFANGRTAVAISGAGAASAVGTGCDALFGALASGRDGLRPIQRFSVVEFATQVAGLWPAWDGRKQTHACGMGSERSYLSALEMAVIAAREAWGTARASEARVPPRRIAVTLGTCFGENFTGFSELTEGVARSLGIEGPCLTISTACSSSTTAVGVGRDLIQEDVADLVLAGGADVLTREVFAGFHALGALSEGKCAPFGESVGTSLGEGAGFVVLESVERAEARRVPIFGLVLGYGLSGDGHHQTSPDPSGSGLVRAIRAAIDDAGISPEDLDYVNAHGTGTDSNDASEAIALRTVLGMHAERIPVSATKSFLGHAQGAAGVLELVATLLCTRRGLVPPTLRCEPARLGAPADLVSGERPRPHPVRRVLKLSAAFGGANAALVVGEAPRPRPPPERRAVTVTGLSAIGPHGLDLAPLQAALTKGRRISGGVAPFDLGRIIRWAPPRDLDPSGQYASAAAALALADAHLVVRGSVRDRTGLFTGTSRIPATSAWECANSVDQRGITHIAAVPFTHMVLNAPAGTCAKLLSLRGPLLAISTGRGSGLVAVVRAAEHLAAHASADYVVAGGLDELPQPPEKRNGHMEGAAFAVLAAGQPGVQEGVLIKGWGLAGPAGLDDAVARAMAGVAEVDGVYAGSANIRATLRGGPADPARLPLGLVDVDAIVGGAESAASAFAFVLAVAALRRGAARRLLVVSKGDSVSCAAVISTERGDARGR